MKQELKFVERVRLYCNYMRMLTYKVVNVMLSEVKHEMYYESEFFVNTPKCGILGLRVNFCTPSWLVNPQRNTGKFL